MEMKVFISPLKNPWKNLSTEEYFLTQYEKKAGHIYLLFYENFTSVVLGRSLRLEEEVFPQKSDIPVLRRMSGGGSVLHFPGNLNYSLFLSLDEFPEFFPVQASYQLILDSLCKRFVQKGFFVQRNGLSDLCVVQKGIARKISGNSQARKRGYLMHHGTFLYQPNQRQRIAYYLKMPPKQPEYREGRGHNDFMICTPLRISKYQLIRCISKAFQELFSSEIASFSYTPQ